VELLLHFAPGPYLFGKVVVVLSRRTAPCPTASRGVDAAADNSAHNSERFRFAAERPNIPDILRVGGPTKGSMIIDPNKCVLTTLRVSIKDAPRICALGTLAVGAYIKRNGGYSE
jgi:hypothetical protein